MLDSGRVAMCGTRETDGVARVVDFADMNDAAPVAVVSNHASRVRVNDAPEARRDFALGALEPTEDANHLIVDVVAEDVRRRMAQTVVNDAINVADEWTGF